MPLNVTQHSLFSAENPLPPRQEKPMRAFTPAETLEYEFMERLGYIPATSNQLPQELKDKFPTTLDLLANTNTRDLYFNNVVGAKAKDLLVRTPKDEYKDGPQKRTFGNVPTPVAFHGNDLVITFADANKRNDFAQKLTQLPQPEAPKKSFFSRKNSAPTSEATAFYAIDHGDSHRILIPAETVRTLLIGMGYPDGINSFHSTLRDQAIAQMLKASGAYTPTQAAEKGITIIPSKGGRKAPKIPENAISSINWELAHVPEEAMYGTSDFTAKTLAHQDVWEAYTGASDEIQHNLLTNYGQSKTKFTHLNQPGVFSMRYSTVQIIGLLTKIGTSPQKIENILTSLEAEADIAQEKSSPSSSHSEKVEERRRRGSLSNSQAL